MSSIDQSGTFNLGDRTVKRLGYGAMQLAGPGVFGPPKHRDAALAVLREAVANGVNHIDTSDFYGPHVTNRLIHEALEEIDTLRPGEEFCGGGLDGIWLNVEYERGNQHYSGWADYRDVVPKVDTETQLRNSGVAPRALVEWLNSNEWLK